MSIIANDFHERFTRCLVDQDALTALALHAEIDAAIRSGNASGRGWAGDLAKLASIAGIAKSSSLTTRSQRLAKGLPTVAAVAQWIETGRTIQSALYMEAKQENDASKVPDRFKQVIDDACDVLNAMCTEETAELIQGQNVDDLNNVPNVFGMGATPLDLFKRARGQSAAEFHGLGSGRAR